MRKPIIAGNWKMNKTPSEARELVSALIPLVKDAKCDVVVCTPAVDFAAVSEVIKGTNIKLGAKGAPEDGALVILCEDRMAYILARKDETLAVIREQAAKLNGGPIKVRVREAGDEIIQENNAKVDELIGHAQELDIEIKTL